MDSIQHKLDEFTKAFLLESSENARQIIQNVKDDRERQLAEADEKIAAEVSAYKRRRALEIRTREGSRVSGQLLENKKRLFIYRQKCAQEVREQVLERVTAFTQSPEYSAHLQSLFSRALDILGYGASVLVSLRPCDMVFKNLLIERAKGVSVGFQEGEFVLGGLKVVCESKGLSVDLTFDEALGNATDHFAELSGIDFENE